MDSKCQSELLNEHIDDAFNTVYKSLDDLHEVRDSLNSAYLELEKISIWKPWTLFKLIGCTKTLSRAALNVIMQLQHTQHSILLLKKKVS